MPQKPDGRRPVKNYKPTGDKLLDDFVQRGMQTAPGESIDELLVEAERYLTDVGGRQEVQLRRLANDSAAEKGQLQSQVASRPDAVMADALGTGANLGSLALSLTGGPLGLAAGGYQTLKSIGETVKDPTWMNAGGAMMGLIPGMRAGSKALKNVAAEAPKVAGKYSGAASGALHGSDMVQDAMSRVSGSAGRGRSPILDRIEETIQRRIQSPVDARMPNTSGFTGRTAEAADDFSPLLQVDRYMPNASSNSKLGMIDELEEAENLATTADREWQAANPALPKSIQALMPSRLDTKADEMIRSVQGARNHGVGGFSRLPELSEGELTRIMANIDRVKAKHRPGG